MSGSFLNTKNDVAITMQLVYIEVEEISNRMRKSGQSRRAVCLRNCQCSLYPSLFFFSLLSLASLGWNLRCALSIALSTGHVNSNDGSLKRKGYYLLRKNRGALKANSTAVYLLRSRWNLRNQRLRWERLCDDIYSSNAIIPNLTVVRKWEARKAKAKDAGWNANYIHRWEWRERVEA